MLRESKDSLMWELDELRRQRQPLIIQSETGEWLCTGSMEPNITCLDTSTWLENYDPADIVIGATISYSVDCSEDEPDEIWTGHRVLDIKMEDGIHCYWPKGDGNDEPDGCWIPQTAVNGYIVELHKNTRPENADLRNGVNAANADYVPGVRHTWMS